MAEKETRKFSQFLDKHAELWKLVKFMIMGAASSIVELAVHYVLTLFVFSGYTKEPFNFLGLSFEEGRGYFYAYLISTTVGYTIAFILNRKITFKADANPVRSVILYIIMVIFTIFATSFLGTAINNWMNSIGAAALGEAISKPIVVILAGVWTYPINRFVIHRKKKPETIEE